MLGAAAASSFSIGVVAVLAVDEMPNLGLGLSSVHITLAYGLVRSLVAFAGVPLGGRLDAYAARESLIAMVGLAAAFTAALVALAVPGWAGFGTIMVGLVLVEMSVFVLGAALKTQLVQPGVDGLRRLLLTVVARLLGMMTALVVVTFVLKGIDDRAVAIAIVGGIGAVVLRSGCSACCSRRARER